jgi:hypothetical protein
MKRLGESFRTRVGQAVQTAEWRGSFHFPREVIPVEARAADLVIIGSHPVRDDVYRAFDPGTVILNAGRPVLFVPDAAAGSSGERAPGAIGFYSSRRGRPCPLFLKGWLPKRQPRRSPLGA